MAITHPDYPGERLIGCRNPALAEERARKRGELLAATEKELNTIAAATRRDKRPLRGKDSIGLRVGKVINKYKMAKHFPFEITDEAFTFCRNKDTIAAETADNPAERLIIRINGLGRAKSADFTSLSTKKFLARRDLHLETVWRAIEPALSPR